MTKKEHSCVGLWQYTYLLKVNLLSHVTNSAYHSWPVTIWPIPDTEFGQIPICGNGLCGIGLIRNSPDTVHEHHGYPGLSLMLLN